LIPTFILNRDGDIPRTAIHTALKHAEVSKFKWSSGLLDWTIHWTAGLDYWTGLLDGTIYWTAGLDYWSGLLDQSGLHAHISTYFLQHIAQSLRPWLVTWVGLTVVILSKSICAWVQQFFFKCCVLYSGGSFSYTVVLPLQRWNKVSALKGHCIYSREFLWGDSF